MSELEERHVIEIEQQQQRIDLQAQEIQKLRSELDSIQQQTASEADYVQERVDSAKLRRARAKAAKEAAMESYDG